MINEKSAGAVVFRRAKGTMEFLLLFREPKLHYTGSWNFPKGLIDDGESQMQAAKREIREETGLTDLKFMDGFCEKITYTYNKENDTYSKEAVFFLAESISGKVKISFEHDDFEWLEYDEAYKRLTFENSKKILRKTFDFLNS
ncbi:MAG: NUDIX domain-containing protein [Nanoarchaeota archaeon]|nr:NUDIX domain-containing protein [Nanoarchaeota archaeon]